MKKENIVLGTTHFVGFILVVFFISTQFLGCGEEEKTPPAKPKVESKMEEKKPEPVSDFQKTQKPVERTIPRGLQPDFIGEFYIIQPGDNLNDLARRYYGTWEHWRDIFHANERKIDDWNVLQPGTRIEIPPLKKQ